MHIPKNILHVVARTDPRMGGVSTAIRTLIDGLAVLHINSEVASLDDPAAPYIAATKFTIHALGPGKGPWSYSNKLIPWLVDNLSRFDAVIIHGLWLFNGYAVEKSMRSFKKGTVIPKVFVMPHGMLDPYFQKAGGRKLKAIRNRLYWKLIESRVVNNSSGILFTCEEERRLAREPFRPYHPKEELIVGLGVNEPPAWNNEMRQALLNKCPEVNNHPYILFLGRVHEKKGVDILINAYSRLLSAENNRQAGTGITAPGKIPGLMIAGPNLESLFGEKVQKMVAENEILRNMVFFPGMLEGNAKWGAVYDCDAFILPSHQENFGIAIVEALACKKPVLISRQVNIWKEIIDMGGGIAEEDTLQGTINLLQEWMKKSTEEKSALAHRARTCFEKNFATISAAERFAKEIKI